MIYLNKKKTFYVWTVKKGGVCTWINTLTKVFDTILLKDFGLHSGFTLAFGNGKYFYSFTVFRNLWQKLNLRIMHHCL